MSQLGPWIERLAGGATEVQPVVRGGVPYMRTTLERSGETGQARPIERFPSLAVDRDGRAYVAFTRQRDANSDVCVRAYDGHTWSADRDVAATDDCEYDATVIVDRNNRAWMSWTGSSDGQHFTVFVAPLSVSGEPGKPMQVTQADDDAMHARMACDRAGDLWITYYKWSKMGPYSRDKEVYARRYKGNAWSDEIHVSPEDVPVYEDHSDPAITSYLDGVLVGWSWDFHKPTGYTQEAEAPTIFVREVSADLTLGRAQDVSGATIDTVPTVAVDGKNGVWCAWDSLDWDSQARAHHKRLLVCRRDLSVLRTPAPHAITDAVTNVCTPTLVAAPEGRLTLVWSEQATAGGPWTLKRADFDERTSQWSRPQVLESKSDPRFPSAAYAPGGQLWVAYACQTEKGRELVVKKPGG
jgi:hypothetical protein